MPVRYRVSRHTSHLAAKVAREPLNETAGFFLAHASRAAKMWDNDAGVISLSFNTYGAIMGRIPNNISKYTQWEALEMEFHVKEGVHQRELTSVEIASAQDKIGFRLSMPRIHELLEQLESLSLKYTSEDQHLRSGDEIREFFLCPRDDDEIAEPVPTWCMEIHSVISKSSIGVSVWLRESAVITALHAK